LWFLWALTIFIGSSIPGKSLPDFSILSVDKLIHAGIYAVLTWFGVMSFKTINPNLSFRRIYLYVFLIHFFYAISDEWHQSFVPNRSCELFDVLADLTGIALAIGLYHWYMRYKVKIN
jgi:VanZ family protein